MVIAPQCKEPIVVNSLATPERCGAQATSQNRNGTVAEASPKRRAGVTAAD
jgi:hypothetical protein